MKEDKSIIDAHELVKVYNESKVPVQAVNGVHLHIEQGEFVALVGPSGSGKTTLLNMIGGLDQPSSGSVEIAGMNITAMRPAELTRFRLLNIGFVFQSFNLIPVLTAKENIEFVMLLQNIPAKQRNIRVQELLQLVGLAEKADVLPAELSGGQQQRVAVARALASRPRFVMADEPTANLDSVSAGQLLDLMEKINREENTTFIFSTHDQRVIERAKRVITLRDGKVVADVCA
jgi:putative ABC transport system ATP-binding protein